MNITTFTKDFFEGMFNLHKPMTKGEFIDNEIKQEKEEELLDSDEDFSNTFPVEGKII